MDMCAIPEPGELKNLEADPPEFHIRKVSSADLADFIDWVEFHRSAWTDDELERYYGTIEHIAEKLVKHRGEYLVLAPASIEVSSGGAGGPKALPRTHQEQSRHHRRKGMR